MTIGIDQSYSHTGVVILDDAGEIKDVHSIMSSNDATKFYPNEFVAVEKSTAYKKGLIDERGQLTKKKKDFSKDELELLKVSYQDRFRFITTTLETILLTLPQDTHVGIENISLFSKGAVVDLARLLGAIEHTVQTHGLQHVLFPPTAVKKFAGKGNASKEEMIEFVPISDLAILKMACPKDKSGACVGLDNLVDAYWIAKLRLSSK